MSEFEQLLDEFEETVATLYDDQSTSDDYRRAHPEREDTRARLLAMYAEEVEKRKKAEELTPKDVTQFFRGLELRVSPFLPEGEYVWISKSTYEKMIG